MKFMTRNENEKTLEARLVEEVRKRGGMAVKLTSQFHRGLPDRLVILPYHTIAFVEVKSPGEKPRPIQVVVMNQLRSMRFAVRVVDSNESLDAFLASVDRRMEAQAKEDADLTQKKIAALNEVKQDFMTEKSASRMNARIKRYVMDVTSREE